MSVYCRTSKLAVTLNVTDVNDNFPLFKRRIQHTTMTESAVVGVHVAQVSATDLDCSSANNKVYYGLEGTHDNFRINNETG